MNPSNWKDSANFFHVFVRRTRYAGTCMHGRCLWISTTWSPFMAFPGQDPQDCDESKWRTSYGRDHALSLASSLFLSRSSSIYRSLWRLSTPFVIRENLETRRSVGISCAKRWKRSRWVVPPPGIRCQANRLKCNTSSALQCQPQCGTWYFKYFSVLLGKMF